MVAIRRRVLVLATAGLMPKAGRAGPPRPRVGAVESVTGRALAHFEPEPPRTLAAAAPVLLQDLLATDADARLACRLETGIALRLGGNATLRVDRLALAGPRRGVVLQSLSGPLSFDRPAPESGRPPPPVTLDLPWARIGVRGTRFFAGPIGGVFGVFCARGLVEVTRNGETWRVRLEPGDGVDIPAIDGRLALPPVRVWGAARIAQAFALLD